MTMADADDYTITGRKIEGDVQTTDQNTTPQISKDDFLVLLDEVLDLPKVKAVIWDQYTPYFNDGDACIFHVHDPRIIFDFEKDDADVDDEESGLFAGDYREYGTGYSTSDLWVRKNPNGDWSTVYLPHGAGLNKSGVNFIADNGLDLEPYYDALVELASTSQWERVALTNFGDHAEVTATKSGFSVETYEHD